MKKGFLLLLALFSIILVGCSSSKSSLEGKWYSVYDGEKTLRLEVNNGKGRDLDDVDDPLPIIWVDEENKQFAVSALGTEWVQLYEFLDEGVVKVHYNGFSSYDEVYYKENSKALEQALAGEREDE